MKGGYLRRRITNIVMTGLTFLFLGIAVALLATVLGYVFVQGLSAVNLSFFTQLPKPVGEPGGGMANAIVGSLILIAVASLIGLPIGIGTGVYLSEYGWRLSNIVRFITDTLIGLPSIIVGIFAYTVVVLPLRSFSTVAGGFALAIIMIPIIATDLI